MSDSVKPNSEASMLKYPANWRNYLITLTSLCLGLALSASAQPRGGTSYGGGGFSGFGGTARSSTSTGAGTTSRQYPNNTTIGDAYFSIDPETRRVVYIADEATARYLGQVLTNLDRPKPQVLIKVVFLEVTRDDASDIGVEGYYSKDIGNSWNSGLVTNYGVVNGAVVPTSITPGRSSSFFHGTNFFGLPSPTSFSGANGIYQIIGQDYQVTLHAIAQAGKAKVLSRPSILARNNQPATITVGQQVPLVTGTRYDNYGNAINSYNYQSVGVILRVTPFITSDGMVQMIISPEISRLDPTTQIPVSVSANGTTINAPVIDVRSADTVAVTPDGQTVVIGGLIQTVKSETVTKTPLLGDIPLLGNFFKRKQTADSKSELIIFLTPHIVAAPTELAALATQQRDRSDATKGLTEQELNKFLDELPKQKAAPDSTQKSKKQPPATPPKGS
jgi:type II secretion system protein D